MFMWTFFVFCFHFCTFPITKIKFKGIWNTTKMHTEAYVTQAIQAAPSNILKSLRKKKKKKKGKKILK